MITNQRQYKITHKKLQQLKASLDSNPPDPHLPLPLQNAMKQGVLAKIKDLQSELDEYDALKSKKHLRIKHLHELPQALIKVRIMRGYTQKQLAEKLGVKTQQIQRYEAQEYAGVKLERLLHIGEVLGLELTGEMSLRP